MGGDNFFLFSPSPTPIPHPHPSSTLQPDSGHALLVCTETNRTPTPPALSRSPGHHRSISLPALISISFIGHPSFSSWTTGAGDRNRIERDSELRGGCGRHIVRLSQSFYLFAGAAEDGHVCGGSNRLFFGCSSCSSGRCVIV